MSSSENLLIFWCSVNFPRKSAYQLEAQVPCLFIILVSQVTPHPRYMGDSKAIEELLNSRVSRLAMAYKRLVVDSTDPSESTPPSESPLEAMLRTWFSRFSEMEILPQDVVDNVRSCPHIHQLLFTVINRKGNLPPLTGFHHWGTGSDRKSRIVPSNRGPNDLRYIYGFQELGTVWIPESNASSLDDVHQYLDSFVPRHQEMSESDITESMVTALRGGGTGEAGGLSSPAIPIQLFTILVYGNAKDELFTGGDGIPFWIWMKPESTYYFLNSLGSDDIDDCIDNEEMQPTKEVHILVRGVERKVDFCSGIDGYEEEPYGPNRPLFIFH